MGVAVLHDTLNPQENISKRDLPSQTPAYFISYVYNKLRLGLFFDILSLDPVFVKNK